MLKRIDPSQAELGMFIHKLEGSFFNHPFWRAKFVLGDERRLQKLRDSALDGVVIDTDKGRDVGTHTPPPSAAPETGTAPARPVPPAQPARRRTIGASLPQSTGTSKASYEQLDLRSTAPQSLSREFGHATAVAERAHKVISRVFIEARLGKSIKAGLVEPVVNEIFASVQRNPHAFNGLMRCKRDNEDAYRHALAVSALMISLGRQLKLSPDELKHAGMVGLMHDIGIGHLPIDLDAVGGDYRRIDPIIMQGHVELGYNLLSASGIPEVVAQACLEHHERFDGAGYPHSLKGSEISTLGKMAAVCDVYDELANDANGEQGLDPATAIAEMGSMSGAFDPAILQALVAALGVYPIGSLVLLRSGRLAMVVDQSADDVSQPTVRAFYSAVTGAMIKPSDIELATCFGEDTIECSARPEEYGIADLPALREKLFVKQAKGARSRTAA